MPKKWWEVYADDEERKFFIGQDKKSSIVRNPDYEWRSVDAIVKESGLPKDKVERLINKFADPTVGVIVEDVNKFAYWERVKKSKKPSVLAAEKEAKEKHQSKPKATAPSKP